MKKYRLKELDKDLIYIQQLAESRGIELVGVAVWTNICTIVTEYQVGKRRYSKSLMKDYGKARVAVMLIVGKD